MNSLTLLPAERTLCLFGASLLALAILLTLVGPALHQAHSYHEFADQRTWAGIPCAANVLSNLAFLLVALLGLRKLALLLRGQQRQAATVFFVGLALTAMGSSWYHLAPSAAGLYLDRLSMVPTFAGLLGLAVGARISRRAGHWATLLSAVAGVLGLAALHLQNSLWPWSVYQAGGMLVVLWCATRAEAHMHDAVPVKLFWVIGLYFIAKILELADFSMFSLLGHSISCHSLKHLLAALAAWPVVAAIQRKTHVHSPQKSAHC
jgi:hypothetical protein